MLFLGGAGPSAHLMYESLTQGPTAVRGGGGRQRKRNMGLETGMQGGRQRDREMRGRRRGRVRVGCRGLSAHHVLYPSLRQRPPGMCSGFQPHPGHPPVRLHHPRPPAPGACSPPPQTAHTLSGVPAPGCCPSTVLGDFLAMWPREMTFCGFRGCGWQHQCSPHTDPGKGRLYPKGHNVAMAPTLDQTDPGEGSLEPCGPWDGGGEPGTNSWGPGPSSARWDRMTIGGLFYK